MQNYIKYELTDGYITRPTNKEGFTLAELKKLAEDESRLLGMTVICVKHVLCGNTVSSFNVLKEEAFNYIEEIVTRFPQIKEDLEIIKYYISTI